MSNGNGQGPTEKEILAIAKKVAGYFSSKTPYTAAELVGAAWEGVSQAARSYRPEKGSFERHAWNRGLGSIRDWLRTDFLIKKPRRAEAKTISSIEGFAAKYQGDTAKNEVGHPASAADGFAAVDDRDEVEVLLSCLDCRSRDIVESSAAGETLKAIGKRWDICESRTSQLRAIAMTKLKERAARRGGSV